MLTEEEKAELREEKCNARIRYREVWPILQQLGELTNSYQKIRDRWRNRFEKADRALAEEEKLTRYPLGKKASDRDMGDGVHLLVKLDGSQLERIKIELDKMEGGETK